MTQLHKKKFERNDYHMVDLDEKRWRQKVMSPRIEALRRELDRSPAAIEEFWESIAETGSPLVEEISGEPDARCVTFVYRDWNGSVDHVALCWFVVLSDFANNLLLRVGNSDLMALSLRLPVGTRSEYLLSPNEPLGADIDTSRWLVDPLNPHWVEIPPNEWRPDVPTQYSLLELPSAAPRVWSRPSNKDEGIPELRLHIDDDGAGRARRVWFQKVGEKEIAPERLLVVLDGWDFVYAKNTPWTLSRLHRAGQIPPTGVVYVDSGTKVMRMQDHTGSRAYSEYLATKIIPIAHHHFGFTNDGRATTICGMSNGGFVALATAFRYPETFGNVLALATPTEIASNDLPDRLIGAAGKVAPERRPRVHLQAGLLEVDPREWPESQILGSNRTLSYELEATGFDVVLDEEACGHGMTDFAESLVKGIRRLFRR